LLTAAIALGTAPAGASEQSDLLLNVDTPAPGSVVGDAQGLTLVSGKALALFGEYQTFDIIFVLDTSHSTAGPAGADIDGDGEIGQRGGDGLGSVFGKILPLPSSDKGDSVLAAEVAAVRTLLEQLDPRTTRVGVVVFEGDQDPLTKDAWVEMPLTTDFRKVERALDHIYRRGPSGMTNMMHAVQLATIELVGSSTAFSTPRSGARRIILFMTDGRPTLPLQNAELQNARMAIDQAVRARKFDVRIDTYALGEEALRAPVVVVEMAAVTGGVFTPVKRPADLRAVFEDVNFSEIEEFTILNKTTGGTPLQLTQNADGSFAALMQLDEGKNLLEVTARATDGSRARRQVMVTYTPGAEAQNLSAQQIVQKNRLLENRLRDLKRRRLKIEAERDEQVRRQIQIEIEDERKKAQQKADEMRKELELEVEPGGRR
jgi:hypothetical protein